MQVLHLMQRIRRRPDPAGGTHQPTRLGDLLSAASRVIRQRSSIFLLSDFISPPDWAMRLGQLGRRHDVTAVRLYDPLEMTLPDLGLINLVDAETGEQLLVDTHDTGFRTRFAAAAKVREAALRNALADAGVDTLELATDDDLFDAILRFAEMRRARSSLSGGGRAPRHLSELKVESR